MTWVKICGITNLEDARTAVEAGADAMGFVFHEKSSRKIDLHTARQIIGELPENVEKVGVFVDTPSRQRVDIFNSARLTAFQLYPFSASQCDDDKVGFEASCFWRMPKTFLCFPMRVLATDESSRQRFTANLIQMAETIQSFSSEHSNAAQLQQSFLDMVFLDSGNAQAPGGTGETFDWQEAIPLVEALGGRFKLVVAGGLTPDNVTEAIGILKPWGVDVSSGVEQAPGKKDPDKVRAFIAAVRRAENV